MRSLVDPTGTLFWLVVFPAYFVCLWLFVLTIIGYASGWRSLARRYAFASSFTGQMWKFQSGKMRWANLGICLTLGSSAEGLYLELLRIFQFKTPPLLIPWEEIVVSLGKTLLVETVRLDLGRELKIPFWIRPKVASRLRLAAQGHWPVEGIG